MRKVDQRIEREVSMRCREWLGPAGQGLTNAEVFAAVGDSLFVLSVRLNVTIREVFRPLTVPLRRFLRRLA